MKLHRREFVELVGASVAVASNPLFTYAGSAVGEGGDIEKNGWRLQVTPAGELASFTDRKLQLLNSRLGDTRKLSPAPQSAIQNDVSR